MVVVYFLLFVLFDFGLGLFVLLFVLCLILDLLLLGLFILFLFDDLEALVDVVLLEFVCGFVLRCLVWVRMGLILLVYCRLFCFMVLGFDCWSCWLGWFVIWFILVLCD